jgi:two-component SAPR family response regulator
MAELDESHGTALIVEDDAALVRSRPDIHVVLISGYLDDYAIRGVLGNIPCTFLPKPFTREQLAAVVVSLLECVVSPRRAQSRASLAPRSQLRISAKASMTT